MKALTRNLSAALLAASALACPADYWTGFGSSLNWSDLSNWSGPAVPGPTTTVYFEDVFGTGYTNAPGRVNNIVDSSLTVGSVYYTATSFGTAVVQTNRFYTTLIPSGVTWTLGGLSAQNPAALVVGDVPGTGTYLNLANWTNYATITGPGTLLVDDPAALVSVGMRNRSTLDLTGLNTFTANLKQLWVGVTTENPTTTGPTSWLLLGKTNTLNTPANPNAPGVLLGHSTNATGTASVFLGEVNQFNTDAFVVGGRRGSAGLFFGAANSNSAAPGNFKLRGSAGGSTPIPTFSIGDAAANPDGFHTTFPGSTASATGTANFSGANVDVLADTIYVGRGNSVAQAASGAGNGTLIVEQGTVNATNVFIALKPPGTNASIAQGALILRSNAVMNVAKDVSLVFRTNGTTFLSESRVAVSNNAVLNIGGNLATTNNAPTGSWTPASVTLGGGTINLTGGGNVVVPVLNGFGTVAGAGSIVITNALAAGTDATVGTLNLGNNLTLGSAVKLTFNLGASPTVGSGINDYLNVANNVTFNNNPLNLTFGAPLVAGTYKLIGYGGAQSGTVAWVNTTRSPIGLDQGNGQVALVVTNFTPGNLVWKATGTSANWNATDLTWNDNTDRFYTFDNVLFDDTGVATTVTISGITNFPASVTFNNSAKDYSLTQTSSGALGGFGGLTKNGTGLLAMGTGGANNYFTGPINLNAGTLRIASFNTGVFGVAGSTTPINIAAGATLDTYGNGFGSSGSYGRPVNLAGNGVDGNGAIVHSNPTGSASPTVTSPNVTLTGNASMGVVATKSLALGGVFAPYEGVLNLAGYTLTTLGEGEARIFQMTANGPGNINVGGASLGLRNSIIDGPGAINLGNALLNFYTGWTTGYLAKAITVNQGAIAATSANAVPVPILSPISISTALSITNTQPILASGVISGNGALNKYGNSNLVLSAANTYTGPTLVGAGRLVLAPGGSLASPLINVASGAGFDATALPGGYTVPSGQTLAFAGTVFGDVTAAAGGRLTGSGAASGSVTVGTGGTLTCGTTVVPGTLTISNSLVLNGGTAVMKLGATTTPGAGVNDLLVVNGDLNLAAPSVIKVEPVATLSGTYTLVQYSGALLGSTNNLIVTSDARYSYTLDTSVPGLLQVTIAGGAGNLTWKGGTPSAPAAWDINTTANWLNGMNPDKFYNGDSVTFDDSSAVNQITLVSEVKPAAITFGNATTAYRLEGPGALFAGSLTTSAGAGVTIANSTDNTFTGAGLVLNAGPVTLDQPTNATLTAKLSGFSALNKSAANTLTVVSSDSSSFYGDVNVNAGRLRVGSSNALGLGTAIIANGATLDFNGRQVTATAVRASGAGNDGKGALNNTGGTQTNAVRSVTLDGDATFGADAGRWDIAPVGFEAGQVFGNNHALTKRGAFDIWVRPTTDTGLGDIDIAEGRLLFGYPGTGLGDPAASLVVRSNATLGFGHGIQAGVKQATVEQGGSLYVIGGTNQFDGPVTLNSGLVSLEPNAELTLAGKVSGPATLTVRGVAAGNFGSLILSGLNTYTGGTLVNDGNLTIATSDSLPANTNVTLISRVPYNNSGHPVLSLGTNVVSPASVLLDMQTVGAAGAAQAGLSGNGAVWSGPIKITGTIPQCSANFSSGLGGLVIAGDVDGSGFTGNVNGNGGVKVSGDGALVSDVTLGGTGIRFNNPLRFNGSLSCNNAGLGGFPGMTKLVLASGGNSWNDMYWVRGVIQLEADEALPPAPINIGTLTAGADHRVVLDLNGHTQTLVNWIERFLGNDPAWFGNSSTNANATLIYAGTGTNSWTTYILDAFDTAATVQKQTALSVTAGYLKLMPFPFGEPPPNSGSYFPSGPPPYPFGMTYTGPTTVTGGTLEVNKYLGLSPVTVSGLGTLAGNGAIGGTLDIAAGGTLAPGTNVIGTLSVSNKLAFHPGSRGVFRYNLSSNLNDQVVAITELTLGGTLVMQSLGGGTLTAGRSFKLFDAASYVAGPVSIEPAVPAPGLAWDISSLAVDGTLKVTTQTGVPPAVSGGTRLSDGNVSFTFTGTPGQPYTLRSSPVANAPVAGWTIVQTGTVPAASFTFTDLGATNRAQLYYLLSTP